MHQGLAFLRLIFLKLGRPDADGIIGLPAPRPTAVFPVLGVAEKFMVKLKLGFERTKNGLRSNAGEQVTL